MHTWTEICHTALTEATGGAVAGAVADSVLYAVDSAKIRHQAAASSTTATRGVTGSATPATITSLYRGLGPSIFLGTVPVFGTFFLLYAPMRDVLLDRYQRPEWLPLASALCAVPATLVGVPADVLKKRLVLSNDTVSARTALAQLRRTPGGLFAGWHVNLLRDLPFAAVKVSLYELFAQYYMAYFAERTSKDGSISSSTRKTTISPLGASVCGVASGVVCGILTCPLDVVNTALKAEVGCSSDTSTSGSTSRQLGPRSSMFQVTRDLVERHGVAALFRGAGRRAIILGVGSSLFWPLQQGVAQSLGGDLLLPEMRLEVYQVGR